MGPFIMASGRKKDLEKEKEFSCGKMQANMKVTGKMTRRTDMEGSSILMEIAITVIG